MKNRKVIIPAILLVIFIFVAFFVYKNLSNEEFIDEEFNIAFTTVNDGNSYSTIRFMDTNGNISNTSIQLDSLTIPFFQPIDWSPNGDKLVFVAYNLDFTRSGIYIISRDGTGLIDISSSYMSNSSFKFSVGSPAWSPDGNTIAFALNTTTPNIKNKIVLYEIQENSYTTIEHPYFSNSGLLYFLDWSHDCSNLAFLYLSEQNIYQIGIWNDFTNDISMVNADPNSTSNGALRWYNENKLIFVKETGSNSTNIFSIDADGSNLISLTTGNHIFSQPCPFTEGKILFVEQIGHRFRTLDFSTGNIETLYQFSGQYGINPVYCNRVILPDLLPVEIIHVFTTLNESLDWQYLIKFKVLNQGNKETGDSVQIYLNCISDTDYPGVNPIRIQFNRVIEELSSQEISDELVFLISPHDIYFKEINRFEIIIDPKYQILESNKVNNIVRFPYVQPWLYITDDDMTPF